MVGNKIKLNMLNSSLPNLSDALNGWELDIKANYITQELVDGKIVNIPKTIKIKGTLQPLKPEDVNLKPEGQRAWAWYQIHTKPMYKTLRVEQIIEINNIPYKIMSVKNCDIYGYIEYHVIRDYGNE